MKGNPKTIYTDSEGSWNVFDTKEYIRHHHIHVITTRGHAGVVERAIKTIKGMMYKRLEHTPERPWYEILTEVTCTYNHHNVQRTIEMTLGDVTKPKNAVEVKRNITAHAKFTSDYPEVWAILYGSTAKGSPWISNRRACGLRDATRCKRSGESAVRIAVSPRGM